MGWGAVDVNFTNEAASRNGFRSGISVYWLLEIVRLRLHVEHPWLDAHCWKVAFLATGDFLSFLPEHNASVLKHEHETTLRLCFALFTVIQKCLMLANELFWRTLVKHHRLPSLCSHYIHNWFDAVWGVIINLQLNPVVKSCALYFYFCPVKCIFEWIKSLRYYHHFVQRMESIRMACGYKGKTKMQGERMR